MKQLKDKGDGEIDKGNLPNRSVTLSTQVNTIMQKVLLLFGLLISIVATATIADEKNYAPAKVIYDITSGNIATVNHILDRASLLQNTYGNDPFNASIILVIHEDAIPLFAKQNQTEYKELNTRAKSLTMADIIWFRLCKASASIQGYNEKDFDEFIALVPMADAEIIELQNQGYGYLR